MIKASQIEKVADAQVHPGQSQGIQTEVSQSRKDTITMIQTRNKRDMQQQQQQSAAILTIRTVPVSHKIEQRRSRR